MGATVESRDDLFRSQGSIEAYDPDLHIILACTHNREVLSIDIRVDPIVLSRLDHLLDGLVVVDSDGARSPPSLAE